MVVAPRAVPAAVGEADEGPGGVDDEGEGEARPESAAALGEPGDDLVVLGSRLGGVEGLLGPPGQHERFLTLLR